MADRQLKDGRIVILDDAGGDRVAWPSCSHEWEQVIWKLRNAPQDLSADDRLLTASLVQAYLDLFSLTVPQRTELLTRIKRATKNKG